MPNPLLQNIFNGVSTNPRDYVRGINPYAPDPMASVSQASPLATQQDNLQSDILKTFGQDDIAEPEYKIDPRYERALAMLEDIATNPAAKRAKAAEDKYYGKGARRVGLGILEALGGGYQGKDYKNPYQRSLEREETADKETIAALGQLIPGMKNIEAEQIKGSYSKYAADLKSRGVEQANMTKLYEAMTKRQISDDQKLFWANRAKEVGARAAMQEFELEYSKKTGNKLSAAPPEAKMLGLFGGKDPSKMTPEEIQKAAIDRALTSGGVMSKMFGGGTTSTTSPTIRMRPMYDQNQQYIGDKEVFGPNVTRTTTRGGNDGLREFWNQRFGGSNVPSAQGQPPTPPTPPTPMPSSIAFPTKLPTATPAPSPVGSKGPVVTEKTGVYLSPASARMAADRILDDDELTSTSRMGLNSALRLWNSGKLGKYTGYVAGSDTAESVRSLLGKNDPDNTNLRTLFAEAYMNKIFQFSGKQTSLPEQKMIRGVMANPGTQNEKTLMQKAVTISALNDAMVWRKNLGGDKEKILKALPLQKMQNAAIQVYDELIKGKKLSEAEVARRLDPEVVYAPEMRQLRGKPYAWDVE